MQLAPFVLITWVRGIGAMLLAVRVVLAGSAASVHSGYRRTQRNFGTDGCIALLTFSAFTALLAVPAFAQEACEPGEDAVTFSAGAIYDYTVPAGIERLRMIVAGGEGGQSLETGGGRGGWGAVLTGTLVVTAGDNLRLLVGTSGGEWVAGGGGGGSFVGLGTTNDAFSITLGNLLVVAGGGGGGGGGGGSGFGRDGGEGGTLDGGSTGINVGSGGGGRANGAGGVGGQGNVFNGGWGGGAGVEANGINGSGPSGGGGGGAGGNGGNTTASGGSAAVGGGAGGVGGDFGRDGGFGGGGGASASSGGGFIIDGGGGGGGYAGGGGGASEDGGGGGGGGGSSFFAVEMFDTSSTATNIGDGSVTFCEIPENTFELLTTPLELDFGDQPLGQPTVPQIVSIENIGTGAVALGMLLLDGAAYSDYAITMDTCSGQQLSPGESCSTEVTFTASAPGVRKARLRVPSNAQGNPHFVALTGSHDVLFADGFGD